MNAARKSLPSRSSSVVLCRAVRAGQLSRRKKATMTTIATMSAINVKATGQERRPGLDDFNMGDWTLGTERLLGSGGNRARARARARASTNTPGCVYKKLPPPTPDRREGRLFPPEQS